MGDVLINSRAILAMPNNLKEKDFRTEREHQARMRGSFENVDVHCHQARRGFFHAGYLSHGIRTICNTMLVALESFALRREPKRA